MGLVVITGGFTLDDTVLLSNEIMRKAPGGNILYSGVGARVWSENVGLLGVVGRDYPQEYINILRGYGFDVSGITRVDYPSIKMWALHEENNKRQLIYKLDSGDNENLDPRIDCIPKAYYEKMSAIHIAALPEKTQRSLISELKSTDRIISLDVVNIPGRIDSTCYRDKSKLDGVTAFLPSIEEVRDIWGEEDLKDIMKSIHSSGVESVVLKRGSLGSLVYEGDTNELVEIPVYPVNAKDTTGAGDAFCGGFISGYNETGSMVEAAIRGNVSASFVIQDFGAMHALDISKKQAEERANYIRKNTKRV